MANNRMFLVYRPTGDCVFLGKRMGFGWYNVPDNVKERIGKLFELAEDASANENFSQDDFAIALESGKNQPHVIDKWFYDKISIPDGQVNRINILAEVPYETDEKI